MSVGVSPQRRSDLNVFGAHASTLRLGEELRSVVVVLRLLSALCSLANTGPCRVMSAQQEPLQPAAASIQTPAGQQEANSVTARRVISDR